MIADPAADLAGACLVFMQLIMPDTFKRIFVPIHREGRIFLAAFALVSLLVWLIWPALGLVGAGLTIWCAYFFRDPGSCDADARRFGRQPSRRHR